MKLNVLVLLVILVLLDGGLLKEASDSHSKQNGRRPKGRHSKHKDKSLVGSGSVWRAPSLLTQVLDKGRFLRLGSSISLSSGKDVELRCKGPRLGWSYPPYLNAYNDSRLSIKQQDKYSQLILASPPAADTGEYSCWPLLCDGTECVKDSDRVSSTYIYFTDKDELFVPSALHFEIAYLRPDQPALVPCRVTEPHTHVTLHREVPPEEVSTDGILVSYNPTKGFTLSSARAEHTGVYYCRATAQGVTQVSNRYQLLYVEVPRGPPFVTIEASSPSLRGGDDLNLTCTVLGEPEAVVHFSWTFPGQGQRPASMREAWRLVTRGTGYTTRMSQSILLLEDMETIDFGRYVCRAKNQQGETSVATSVTPI